MAKKTTSPVSMTFAQMLNYFQSQAKKLRRQKLSTINSYANSYLPAIDRINGGQTAQWLIDIILSGSNNPIGDAMAKFDAAMLGATVSAKTITNWRVAFAYFAHVILGYYYANVWFVLSVRPLQLCQMVASNALFASQSVVNDVISGRLGTKNNLGKGNPDASWDNYQHVRNTSVKKGTPLAGGKIADDNTYSNCYIKRAIHLSGPLAKKPQMIFHNYTACHIWDTNTFPYLHASIKNLVLIPAGLAGATDFDPNVQQMLRYRAQQLFGLVPTGVTAPTAPTFYKSIIWR